MRYVSHIEVDGVPVDSYQYLLCTTPVVTVRDSVTGAEEVYNDVTECLSISGDVLGFSREYELFVKQTPQSVKLHDYIEVQRNVIGGWSYRYSLANQQMTTANWSKHWQDSQLDIYDIGQVDSFGYLGSCLLVQDLHHHTEFMSVYDMLLSLCRKVNLSLMQFGSIRLVGPGGRNKASGPVIRFKHSPEADRFFTKMAVLG